MSYHHRDANLDYLDIANKVTKILEDKSEKVVFSDHVIKINRKGAQQKRVLMLTNRNLYNINKGMFFEKLTCSKGAMGLSKIKKVTLCTETKQSIIHVVDGYTGYDYHYFSDRCEEVSELLLELFSGVCSHRKLAVNKLQPSDIEDCRYSIDRLSLSEQGMLQEGMQRNLKARARRLSTESKGSRGSGGSIGSRDGSFFLENDKSTSLSDFPEEVLLHLFKTLDMKDAARLMVVNRRLNAIGKLVSKYWAACKSCGRPLLSKKGDLVYNKHLEILGHDGRLVCTKVLPSGVKLSKNHLFLRDLDQNALILFGGYFMKMFGEQIDYEKFDEFFDELVVRHLNCKGCNLYLGFKIDTSQISLNAEVRVKEKTFPIDCNALDAKDMKTLGNLYQLLGEYSQMHYFAETYLRWYDREKEDAQWKFLDSHELRCKAMTFQGKKKKKDMVVCDTVLGNSKDVVCKPYHMHDVGNGEESTFYLSQVEKENVEVGKKQADFLSVGPMYFRDLKCKGCGTTVGLKYESVMVLQHDWRPRNAMYEGRYGIVKSAIVDDKVDANALNDQTDLAVDFQLLCRKKGLDYKQMKANEVEFWSAQVPAEDEEEFALVDDKGSSFSSGATPRASFASFSGSMSFSASFTGVIN